MMISRVLKVPLIPLFLLGPRGTGSDRETGCLGPGGDGRLFDILQKVHVASEGGQRAAGMQSYGAWRGSALILLLACGKA